MNRRNFLGLMAAAGVVLEAPRLLSGGLEPREDGLYVPTDGELVLATELPVRLLDKPSDDDLCAMVESINVDMSAFAAFGVGDSSPLYLSPSGRIEIRLVVHAAGAPFTTGESWSQAPGYA